MWAHVIVHCVVVYMKGIGTGVRALNVSMDEEERGVGVTVGVNLTCVSVRYVDVAWV